MSAYPSAHCIATLSWFEELLSRGDFCDIDELLVQSPTTDDDPETVICILAITKHAPTGRLKERPAFVERARSFLVQRLGADRTAKLMEHRS